MDAYGLDSVIGRELGGSHLSGIDSLLAEHQLPITASIFWIGGLRRSVAGVRSETCISLAEAAPPII